MGDAAARVPGCREPAAGGTQVVATPQGDATRSGLEVAEGFVVIAHLPCRREERQTSPHTMVT